MLRIQRVSLRLSWGGEAEDPCKLPLRLSRPSLQRSAAILADAGLRRSEWVSLVFLIYAASIGRALPIAPSLQTRTVVVNLAILIVYGLLIRADAVRPRMITSVIRDWLPLAVIILAYREVGFALPYPGHRLEMRWVAWDRAFLRGGAKAAIESSAPCCPPSSKLPTLWFTRWARSVSRSCTVPAAARTPTASCSSSRPPSC